MTERSNEEIEELAGEIAPVLFAYATVSDNWVNQLKTYQNISVTEENVGTMYFYTIALYIELVIARIGDLTTPKEKTKLEVEIIKLIVRMMVLISDSRDPKANKEIAKVIVDTIAGHRKAETKHKQTIFNTYLATFFETYTQVPKEYLSAYLEDKVKLLEEKNFRKLLTKSGLVF